MATPIEPGLTLEGEDARRFHDGHLLGRGRGLETDSPARGLADIGVHACRPDAARSARCVRAYRACRRGAGCLRAR